MKTKNLMLTIKNIMQEKRKIISLITFTFAFFLFSITQANASLVYFNDFQGSVGNEWSNASTEDAPNPDLVSWGRFLGQFGGADTVSLSLSGLPSGMITISFDTYFIRSWDGNDTTFGPEFFAVSTNTGLTLLYDTFSNGNPAGQSYVGNGIKAPAYQFSSNTSMTGSLQQYSLGYFFYDWPNSEKYETDNLIGEAMDSVYHFDFSFLNTEDDLEFIFAGIGLQSDWVTAPNGDTYRDESWGLDNVKVSVPEPSSLILLISSLFGLIPLYRSKKKN